MRASGRGFGGLGTLRGLLGGRLWGLLGWLKSWTGGFLGLVKEKCSGGAWGEWKVVGGWGLWGIWGNIGGEGAAGRAWGLGSVVLGDYEGLFFGETEKH